MAIAEPIPLLDALIPKPHVEIDYANITGRVNGNIKEFLGALKPTIRARNQLHRYMTDFYKASPSLLPADSSTRSSSLSS